MIIHSDAIADFSELTNNFNKAEGDQAEGDQAEGYLSLSSLSSKVNMPDMFGQNRYYVYSLQNLSAEQVLLCYFKIVSKLFGFLLFFEGRNVAKL